MLQGKDQIIVKPQHDPNHRPNQTRKLATYPTAVPSHVVGDKTIEARLTGVVVAGATYSIASSSGGEDSVYVNGRPVADSCTGTKGRG